MESGSAETVPVWTAGAEPPDSAGHMFSVRYCKYPNCNGKVTYAQSIEGKIEGKKPRSDSDSVAISAASAISG